MKPARYAREQTAEMRAVPFEEDREITIQEYIAVIGAGFAIGVLLSISFLL